MLTKREQCAMVQLYGERCYHLHDGINYCCWCQQVEPPHRDPEHRAAIVVVSATVPEALNRTL